MTINKAILWTIIVGATFSSCAKTMMSISNPSERDIADKQIVMSRAEVQKRIKTNDINFIRVISENGVLLPSQTDDMDGDGIWDEVAFLIDLKKGERAKVRFESGPGVRFDPRTNLRFGLQKEPHDEAINAKRLKTADSPSASAAFQMEGPAWENDKVAFRNYFDFRNSMDIFGKSTTKMVLDNIGIRGQNYHIKEDWGMDVLIVGNSLGAGATAIEVNDTLYRVGPCREGTYSVVTEGPVRSVIDLDYYGVPVGSRLYDVKHRITIAAGDLCYKSEVWVSGLHGDESLVTGIVDKHQLKAISFNSDKHKGFYTHGAQGTMKEILGMAVAAPNHQDIIFGSAPKTGTGVTETYTLKIKLEEGQPAVYYFFSGWEHQNSDFMNAQKFEKAVIDNLNKF